MVLSRKEGESVVLEGIGTVYVSRILGGRVQLAFDFPPDVSIVRGELPLIPKGDADGASKNGSPTRAT